MHGKMVRCDKHIFLNIGVFVTFEYLGKNIQIELFLNGH